MARNSRNKGNRPATSSEVPLVYRDMLAEAYSTPVRSDDDGRSIKKRRVGGRVVTRKGDQANGAQSVRQGRIGQNVIIDDPFEKRTSAQQHVMQSSSEDSADSDVNWEEVHLDAEHAIPEDCLDSEGERAKDLNLTLPKSQGKATEYQRVKRRPIAPAEKELRLAIHKMHLCSLLVHIYSRNHWCNDENVHSVLQKLLTRKMVRYLNPDEIQTQFQQSRSFMDGLQQASDAFRAAFKITARGMARSKWANPVSLASTEIPKDIDLPMLKEDFLLAAEALEASRDVGAQLFCAMLRTAGVNARLVCSLQTLPFHSGEKVPPSHRKYAATVMAEQASRSTTPEMEFMNGCENEDIADSPAPLGSHIGQSHFASDKVRDAEADGKRLSAGSRGPPKKPIRESRYPVYWVEAFNEAVQKWIPVDPLVTRTISKSSKFEPPAVERENNLTYVVAFEDDGSARDVTRRYAKAFNAKTRRDRVEATKGGERWWEKVMKIYKRSHRLDRDQLEDAELAAKEAAEPMPRNVQDFKDHPYYALERHMRRHQVIHPKREVGKVGAGRVHNASTLEPVYRRRDVLNVQSADKWYRMGRQIKHGEQPLKRVPTRRPRESSVDMDDAIDGNHTGTALYEFHQTTPYEAPPVVDGRIPKNMYGNLDVYVSSMVPPGGIHIRHPETARAAKLLGVDYADAVTGFTFKGRHGSAVINGAVIAAEYADAVQEALTAFDDEHAHAEEERRTMEVLAMWKRLLTGLRIRERIDGYDVEGQRDEGYENLIAVEDNEENGYDNEGGFLPDRDCGLPSKPSANPNFCTSAMPSDEELHMECETADKTKQRSDQDAKHSLIDACKDGNGGGFLGNEDGEEMVLSAAAWESLTIPAPKTVGLPGTAEKPDDERLQQANDTDNGSSVNRDAETSGEGDLAAEGIESLHTKGDVSLGLTREQLNEARLLEQLYAHDTTNARLSRDEHPNTKREHMDKEKTHPSSEMAHKNMEDMSAPQGILSHEDATGLKVDESEEEKGSLLSQDSAEEDVEPEWLA
ncbi:MAG: hypothetical protein Q9217_001642 [Psora testacea]